ncbi:MAG: penicillin acylase family protein [Anaerolinea sp.]|nr:penicillin acylase family protein [Anaerolinea sp.]
MARKILFILLGLVIVLALVLVGALFFVRSSATTKTDGALTVAGLQSTVTVYRDQNGVPNIYADNTHDLFFAQGYVQAQDRLFQMDFQRRVGLGRLSEVLGEATLKTDQFLRTLGSGRAAAEDLAMLSDDTLAILQAYADGVNAFIAANPDKLPVEFRILGYTPEPWQPLHSVAWGKMMAWNLGGNWETELMTAQLIEALGPEAAATLMARYPEEGPFIIPPEVKSFAGLGQIDMSQVWAIKRLLKVNDPGVGSNNWVVAGSRTTTGMPLLANDPHLGMQIPSVWYANGLHGAGFDVVGVVFPGVPGVVIGHNSRIAWGVTNLGPDVQDMFIEKINPDNPNQYEFQGQWLDMQVIEEPILVKGRTEPVIQTVRITRHGPIMNAVSSDIGESAPPLAMQWTALQGTPLSQAILRIDQAQNWEQFRAALQDFAVPAQNFVYADVEGNIGYQAPGWIPIRAAGDGTVPVPGWTGEYEWTGFIPYEELPFVFNPSVGYVATANNQAVPDSYPYLLTTDWAAPYRAQRIVELIESKPQLSSEDFAAIQGDVHPVPTDIFTPLLEQVDLAGGSAAVQQARAALLAWNRQMAADSAEPLIFELYQQKLISETLGDEIVAAGGEELAAAYLSGFRNNSTQAVQRLTAEPDNIWWDDVRTPAVERRDDIVARALTLAVAELQGRFGDNAARWRWGDAHWTNFDHLVFAAVSPLDGIFNRSIPAMGSSFTVNAAGVDYDDLTMNSGASFRQIIDLGDLNASQFIYTTGQSGNVFSPHYDDMVQPWQGVQYIPLRFDQADIQQTAQETLVLQPAAQ